MYIFNSPKQLRIFELLKFRWLVLVAEGVGFPLLGLTPISVLDMGNYHKNYE